MSSVDFDAVVAAGTKWVDPHFVNDLSVQLTWPNMYARSQQVNCNSNTCEYHDYADLPAKLATGEFHTFDNSFTDITMKGPVSQNAIRASLDDVA